MKPYKAATPCNTITKIRNILNNNNILTAEQPISNDKYHYSTRITLLNPSLEKYEFGTNGKGMTLPYSIASGYGELMERLQNRMFIFQALKYLTPQFIANNIDLHYLSQIKNDKGFKVDYRFYPDEINYKMDGRDAMTKHITHYFPRTAKHNSDQSLQETTYHLISAPFENVVSGNVENLPLYLMMLSVSTTGMCAGNSKAEAIIQGMNEIFERYILQLIFTDNIIAPTICNSYFKDSEILSRLMSLQTNRNISFEIKDYSLNGEIPVIGLLLIDKTKNKYALRLGAHIDPVVALERCYTEAFQGVENYSSQYFNDIDFEENIDYAKEFNQNVINGFGKLPISIFNSIDKEFKGFDFPQTKTIEEDLNQYVERIKELGLNIFVRNNSFMGFPSYYVYIPGMSDIDGRLTDMFKMVSDLNNTHYNVKSDYRIKHLTNSELNTYACKLEDSNSKIIKLFPYNNHPHNSIDRHMLLAIIYASLEQYTSAHSHFRDFLLSKKRTSTSISSYYYCLRDYLYFMSVKIDSEQMLAFLTKLYGEKSVHMVVEGMKNRDVIFSNLKLPNCFDCPTCPIANECDFLKVIEFESNLQMRFSAFIDSKYK